MTSNDMIDLVAEDHSLVAGVGSDLDQIRSVLLGPTVDLVEEQQRQIEVLTNRIATLEQIIIDKSGRAQAVDAVLVDAVRNSTRQVGELGYALQPEIDKAVYASARAEDTLLAEALYPVIGPAVRKMIAAMFTPDSSNAFHVEQILLIERSTGLMLASTATDARALDDADVVSGMIDALTTFVQDAFEASGNDGFSDLRVGDLSLLVETGPQAVIASVVRGLPTQAYRDHAADTLETFHVAYSGQLANFDGSIEAFDGAADALGELHAGAAALAEAEKRKTLVVFVLAASVLIALLAVGGVLLT